jgi:hypothetical protein
MVYLCYPVCANILSNDVPTSVQNTLWTQCGAVPMGLCVLFPSPQHNKKNYRRYMLTYKVRYSMRLILSVCYVYYGYKV